MKPAKAYFRLIDPDLTERAGKTAYLHADMESWTDNPAEALKTSEADWWVENCGFVAEPIPADQEMRLHQQPGLFDASGEAPPEKVPGLGAWRSDDELLGLTIKEGKRR